MSNHLTEGWPLGHTSAVYMDGTAGYHVRHYGKPGILAVPALTPDQAQAIRDVVEARIAEVVLAHTAAVPEALRSAADDLVLPGSSDRGYYSGYVDSGYNEAEVHAEAWLKDRADKIEEGES